MTDWVEGKKGGGPECTWPGVRKGQVRGDPLQNGRGPDCPRKRKTLIHE